MIIFWLTIVAVITIIFFVRTIFVATMTPQLPQRVESQPEKLFAISVLLPVRNEAHRCLSACIKSILAQTEQPLEVIILNDRSNDDTVTILNDGSILHHHLVQVALGDETPIGWKGKLFALEQAKRLSVGEWLLLMDADVIFSEDTLIAAQTVVARNNLDALSLLPRVQMLTFWEKVVMPVMIWFSIMRVSPTQANRSRSRASFGFGNFILVRRDAHDMIGGFSSYREDVLDDCVLMERLKNTGFKVAVYDGSHHINTRMYRGLKEIFMGLAKNSFAALRFSSLRLLCFWCFEGFIVIGPLMLLLYEVIFGQDYFIANLCAFSVSIMFITQFVFAYHIDASLWASFFYSIGHMVGLSIVTYSALAHWLQFPIRWKDRDITYIRSTNMEPY